MRPSHRPSAMRLVFKELGAGEPLVLLHGLLGSSDNWLGVAPALAKQSHLFIPDLRNHGLSPHSATMDYPIMADDVRVLLDAHGVQTAHLMGHSMGGKVAMEYVLRWPERTKSLIVEDMAPRAYKPVHDVIFSALMELDLGGFQTRQQIEDALAPRIHSLVMRRFLLKNLGRDATGKFYWKTNLRGLADNYSRLNEPISSETPFQKPTLFIHGEKSNHIHASDEPVIHKLFPKSSMETIPEAGHWVHVDAPREFVDCVLKFLEAVCAG